VLKVDTDIHGEHAVCIHGVERIGLNLTPKCKGEDVIRLCRICETTQPCRMCKLFVSNVIKHKSSEREKGRRNCSALLIHIKETSNKKSLETADICAK
jgi:hypothetical protein